MSCFRCLFALLFLGPSLLNADWPTATIQDADGQTHTGLLAGWSADRIELEIAGERKAFLHRNVIELRLDVERSKDHLSGAVVFFANGDRIVGDPVSMDETEAVVRWESILRGQALRVPLEKISGVIFDVPKVQHLRRRSVRSVMNRKENQDLVDLKNGDQIAGEFLGLTKSTLNLEGPAGQIPLDRKNIRLMTMNRELISFPKAEGKRFLISLKDGSRLTASKLELANRNTFSLAADFGAEFHLPAEEVTAIRFLGGRAVDLSDLDAAKFEHTPYLSGDWPFQTDRNALGEPLKLDGREYAKGIGLHSWSELHYDLDGAYRTFRATIGVDDVAGARGSVVFVVNVDGKTAFRSEPQTAAHQAMPLPPIDVTGAKRLSLVVEFAEFGDVLDYANWCDAVLIR